MINVYIRKRVPVLYKEIVHVYEQNNLTVVHPNKENIKKKFTFDRIFNENTTNYDIFSEVFIPYQNLSLTYFMYGYTGTGKTYTVLGNDKDDGILKLIMIELLKREESIEISAYQIYNEIFYDLITSSVLKCYEGDMKKLKIVNLKRKTIFLKTLDKHLKIISSNRQCNSNNINNISSRSHAIIELYIGKQTIRLVDLAGNEKSYQSNIIDNISKLENKYINLSLLSLKECIRSMNTHQKYIPFRRSKLTSCLRDCFQNSHKNIMISTIMSTKPYYHDICYGRYYFDDNKWRIIEDEHTGEILCEHDD